MEPTRRWWGTVALAALLAAGAAVLDRPQLLVGTVGLGAWLVAAQASFVRDVHALQETLAVDQTVAPVRLAVGDDLTLSLTVERTGPTRRSVSVTAAAPAGVAGPERSDRTTVLDADESDAATAFTVTPQVVGETQFGSPTVTVTSPLFSSEFTTGGAVSATVGPRGPTDVHVGEGGDRFAAPFGKHAAGQWGSGLELSNVRQYVSGDDADRIDWNATARLGEPHVVEYESKVDIRWLLVVDRRPSMADGPPGETKLDYARQVALGTLHAAQKTNDPVGLVAVGSEGLTHRERPSADSTHYAWLHSLVRSLDPVTDASASSTGKTRRTPQRARIDARTAAARLESDDSPFASALGPFFDEPGPTEETGRETSLHETLTQELARLRGTVVTIVLTDDTRRDELRETVEAAQHNGEQAVVFLTPSVLFETTGIEDLDDAYHRYVRFEEFRRSLSGGSRRGTRVYEVGPRERVETLSNTASRRRAKR
ncbi:hypothetical protein BV210_05835 [Halorientalis sp. IM1011]|uniref:DUF58 domain-containing protein n=1 Tax=Halorientalis sp. IM1011 TaxID=1932360 RepID=UPI00097CD458|nr:DUF58 domain-containing protein [Halorientalis sp. IM1011]AQL42262.1 hypothetical protein BV210_05835 [Halorientalis sp. IM1011]